MKKNAQAAASISDQFVFFTIWGPLPSLIELLLLENWNAAALLETQNADVYVYVYDPW
jgi:hypothetical protein